MSIDPKYLGRIQCYNYQNQCSHGEEIAEKIMKNKPLEDAFESACGDEKGSIIRCCPLDLINQSYQPDPNKQPIHVKFKHGQYISCPQAIKAQCNKDRLNSEQDINLCQAGKCNDAGYLEAENYYQICKSFRRSDQQNDDVPDCLQSTCSKLMQIPNWLEDQLTGKSPNGKTPQRTLPNAPKQKTLSKTTLDELLERLPQENKFYSWGAIYMGLIALLLILFTFFSQNI